VMGLEGGGRNMPRESLVKIIPRPKEKFPLLLTFLLWFSLICLMALGVGFFFLQDKISSLKSEKENLEKEKVDVDGNIQELLNGEIFSSTKKIKDFSILFEEHKMTSKIFGFIESFCHPRVQFISLTLDSKVPQLNLTGKTDSFEILGEQLIILEENKDIKGLNLSNISLERDGRVKFNLTFSFSPSIIKR